MLRIIIVALLGTTSLAKAQEFVVASEYFVVCARQTDMFVLTHTWKFYGYDEFVEALSYYVTEKRYDDSFACEEYTGQFGPDASKLKTTLLEETEFLFPDGEGFFMYTWLSETPEGVFTVLSTTLPP